MNHYLSICSKYVLQGSPVEFPVISAFLTTSPAEIKYPGHDLRSIYHIQVSCGGLVLHREVAIQHFVKYPYVMNLLSKLRPTAVVSRILYLTLSGCIVVACWFTHYQQQR